MNDKLERTPHTTNTIYAKNDVSRPHLPAEWHTPSPFTVRPMPGRGCGLATNLQEASWEVLDEKLELVSSQLDEAAPLATLQPIRASAVQHLQHYRAAAEEELQKARDTLQELCSTAVRLADEIPPLRTYIEEVVQHPKRRKAKDKAMIWRNREWAGQPEMEPPAPTVEEVTSELTVTYATRYGRTALLVCSVEHWWEALQAGRATLDAFDALCKRVGRTVFSKERRVLFDACEELAALRGGAVGLEAVVAACDFMAGWYLETGDLPESDALQAQRLKDAMTETYRNHCCAVLEAFKASRGGFHSMGELHTEAGETPVKKVQELLRNASITYEHRNPDSFESAVRRALELDSR